MISIKLKTKLEILYLIIQSKNEPITINKNKITKTKVHDSISSLNENRNGTFVNYTKLENIPGFESRLSEVNPEEKDQILTFLKSIDISLTNQIFCLLNSNQFYKKIKTKSGILIVRNYINEMFININEVFNNNEDTLENENIEEEFFNNDYLQKNKNLNEENFKNKINLLDSSNAKNKHVNFIGNLCNIITSNQQNNAVCNQSNFNTNNNKKIKSANNFDNINKQNYNLSSNSNTNNNLLTNGNTNNNNIINNHSSNNPLINNIAKNAFSMNKNKNNINSANLNTQNKLIHSNRNFIEVKLNDECEVFLYLNEFFLIDEYDAIEIYDLFKFNENFSINENTLFIIIYMISAFESRCLEDFFNIFSGEIFEMISCKQKTININRLKDTGRLLGFNEFQLMKICKEMQLINNINSKNSSNNNENTLIDIEKFTNFYLLLGKNFDLQTNNSITNTDYSETKKGNRSSTDCFSKACNIL